MESVPVLQQMRVRSSGGRKIAPFLTALLLIVAGLALDALWFEPDSLVVKHVTLHLQNWTAAGGAPLTVAAISDLHIGSPHVGLDKLRTIVDTTNAQNPDVIVLLGDFVIGGLHGSAGVTGGTFIAAPEIAKQLGRLHAPLGVYAVLGNHDWWQNGPAIRQALTKAGIAVLENQAVPLHRAAGNTVWLGGITDLWTGKPDIRHTLAQVTDNNPVILITHNPDVFPDVPARVSLLIAGHTHGGQVNLPFVGRLITTSRFRYDLGHIVDQGRHLFVTTGVGTSIYPIRFGVPPEIVMLALTGAITNP